ncbi:leucyl aminopeptidase [Psychromonas sp. CNPT3]|uniref:leucyl aminopeptidase n=1 Tax=Psychromonas sp. CNPT3 TaxID=314282 RepID=UPI00006EA475|nr:leucyl aminopeptidase [Psychromonas sp. CNPT3]AGH82256.1 leucyl aminopeptidase [Psychromonas sp. CNPT3]
MKFNFSPTVSAKQDTLLVPIFSDNNSSLEKLACHQAIQALIDAQQISTAKGEVTAYFFEQQKVLLLGAGKKSELNENRLQSLIESAVKATKTQAQHVAIFVDALVPKSRDINWTLTQVSQYWVSNLYAYDTTKSKKESATKTTQITFISATENEKAVQLGYAIAQGMNITKELGNLPSNICTPTYLAEHALALSKNNSQFSCEVLGADEMYALGMHSFLSVSKGSDEPEKLIVLKYQGAQSNEAPHILVGKGITFDSGGISLKPGAGMEEMKYDMGGAASVLGTMNTLALLTPKINVIAIIAAAENMPSARASKPGDVITSMNGKTIEIINTDAEGRLVLADALTYAERFEPASVVDIATLTGAVIVGLGSHPTAVYANDDALSKELLDAGLEAWDRGWPMPLWENYEEEITTPFADLRNTGNVGRAGGSITAAMFLKAFAEKYTWAHLDIAGTAWTSGKNMASTGRPVPMLTHYLLNKIK